MLSVKIEERLSKRSGYVLAENDRMIAPDLQHMMSSRITAQIVRVLSSHVVMLSHPEAAAAVIMDEARARPSGCRTLGLNFSGADDGIGWEILRSGR